MISQIHRLNLLSSADAVAVALLLVGMMVGGGMPLADATVAKTAIDAELAAVMDCAQLVQEDFTRIAGAPATVMTATVVAASGETEEYCAAKGYIQPQIQFEMRLPTQTWNGRYFQGGCGGFCRYIPIARCEDALAQDFAVAAHNMGHVDRNEDGLWGSVPALRVDYGRRSTHVMAVVGKAIVERYYGKQAAYSYFRGCSTGGREGLSEAQHYPEDFDGIIAGDPAFPGRLGAMANNWDSHALFTPADAPIFTQAKAEMLHAAVMKQCDAIDGLADGIIGDPRNCDFDITSVACSGGRDKPDCLSAAQVAAARKLYDGPHSSRGERLFPGNVVFGSELSFARSRPSARVKAYLRFMAFEETPAVSISYRDFNFDTDVAKTEATARIYDPVPPHEDPDLSGLRRSGGKLIVYHGWADPGVSPLHTLDYYAEVTQREGGIDSVQDWFRVFMVPGMLHCRGGNAPNTFDMLKPMMAWVEQGKAPDRIIATQSEDGQLIRSRPLFPYPTVARYTGKGDVNKAANWKPARPKVSHDDDIKWIWDPD